MMGRGPMMHGFGAFGPFGGFRDLQVAVPLSDGQWLSFVTALPQGGPALSRQFLISMALMAIIILAVSVWVVRRVTAPLASLSAAAEILGNDLNAPPMPETGTVEMRQASRAFNTMQARLRSLVENRTRMLAAISHDLRTPLTLLRLRAENVEEAPEREKMLATIAEMDSMIAATLEFARDEAMAEPRRRTDLTALLASVVDDMADTGLPVAMESAVPIVRECQPAALKRALTNLLDNAVKYGKKARAAIRSTPQSIEITIDDEGPGIPEDELVRVFQPFYRVEGSRSRETGGIGLGLAIALSVIQAHGGELTLSNRPGGGLRASVGLPVRLS
jgi:signal transduction histidine kinase